MTSRHDSDNLRDYKLLIGGMCVVLLIASVGLYIAMSIFQEFLTGCDYTGRSR